MKTVNKNQNGFVSIFIVIFTAILISVVAIGFIRIMISDQQQATTNDLSRSAYDSALAGVEDAKRALVKYQNLCPENEDNQTCNDLRAAIESTSCNDSVRVLGDVNGIFEADKEGTVKTGEENSLDQAYTCVKIKMNTDNYMGSLSQDSYKMIPLSAESDFNRVQIDWFSADDATSNSITLNNDTTTPLFTTWNQNTPPVLRAQFIQFAKTGFNLSQLNNSINGTDYTGANTMFLYPYRSLTGTDVTEKETALDGRGELNNVAGSLAAPQLIKCANIDSGKLYSCSVKIILPTITPANQVAFLNLSAFYNKANYKVTLLNVTGGDSNMVRFNGVQPEVDSTGRANDLFRRVKTRIELVDPSYPYPEAAVDITGSLCKDFSVTDTSFVDTNPCTE